MGRDLSQNEFGFVLVRDFFQDCHCLFVPENANDSSAPGSAGSCAVDALLRTKGHEEVDNGVGEHVAQTYLGVGLVLQDHDLANELQIGLPERPFRKGRGLKEGQDSLDEEGSLDRELLGGGVGRFACAWLYF